MNVKLRSLAQSRALRVVAVVIVLLGAAAFVWGHYSNRRPTVPVFQVVRGEFQDTVQFQGQLKAQRTITLSAPANAGMLQIVKISSDGSHVAKGDVVVQFDASKTQQELAQDRVALKSAQAQIDQARAQGLLQQEQDTTALMKAQYDVKTAKLDASKQEIVSRIEGAEANLKVEDAVQSLHEAETKLKADKSQAEATISSGKHAREKARADVERAESALQAMTLKAPSKGVIGLTPIWHNGSVAPFKPGDQVWPGAPLAELPDLSSLLITAHVDETDRGRLSLRQPASLQLDAIADRQFTGHIDRIGTIATSDFSAGWPFPRNFDLEVSVDQRDQRLRPGMNVQVTVIVDRVPNAISIPAQASFQREGHTVAYVWQGSKFVERTIQVARRSRDQILIASGLNAGDRIALKDPTVKQ